jgi:hypothetical protein
MCVTCGHKLEASNQPKLVGRWYKSSCSFIASAFVFIARAILSRIISLKLLLRLGVHITGPASKSPTC